MPGNGKIHLRVQQLDRFFVAGESYKCHFWFIIIHPFDDGNGRIARAITDMLLACSDGSGERFYSLSGQMMAGTQNLLRSIAKSTTQLRRYYRMDRLVFALSQKCDALY